MWPHPRLGGSSRGQMAWIGALVPTSWPLGLGTLLTPLSPPERKARRTGRAGVQPGAGREQPH